MRYLKAGAAFLVAFLMQGSLISLFSIAGHTPNLLLMLVVVVSFLYDKEFYKKHKRYWHFVCFVLNLVCSPYRKYNKTLKKTSAYLKQCITTKPMPNMTKISLPQNMLQDLENYLFSKDKFPSEVIKFQKIRCRGRKRRFFHWQTRQNGGIL